MINAEKNALEDIAIEDSVAEISTEAGAKIFIQTIISKFQDKYTIENPDNVQRSIRPVVRALQGLQRKGYDMGPYAKLLVETAAQELEKYSGPKDYSAHKSTLIVTDAVMHKRDTGYWKKKR